MFQDRAITPLLDTFVFAMHVTQGGHAEVANVACRACRSKQGFEEPNGGVPRRCPTKPPVCRPRRPTRSTKSSEWGPSTGSAPRSTRCPFGVARWGTGLLQGTLRGFDHWLELGLANRPGCRASDCSDDCLRGTRHGAVGLDTALRSSGEKPGALAVGATAFGLGSFQPRAHICAEVSQRTFCTVPSNW